MRERTPRGIRKEQEKLLQTKGTALSALIDDLVTKFSTHPACPIDEENETLQHFKAGNNGQPRSLGPQVLTYSIGEHVYHAIFSKLHFEGKNSPFTKETLILSKKPPRTGGSFNQILPRCEVTIEIKYIEPNKQRNYTKASFSSLFTTDTGKNIYFDDIPEEQQVRTMFPELFTDEYVI